MRIFKAVALRLFALFAVFASAQSQTIIYVVDSFDASGTGGNSYSAGQITNVWGNWFGSAFQSLAWDPNSDASNNPNSGSLKITADFNGSGSIPNQFEVFDGFNGINPPLNGLQFTNFQCDVRFAANSATVTAYGTTIFGYLQFGIATPGYGQDYFGGIGVPASNTNWVHISMPLNALADTNLLYISDVLIHIYGPYYSPGLSGTTVLWIDNIEFTGSASSPAGCVVDWNDVHQRIDGFGASSAWTAPSLSDSQADMFFSTNTGIGLSLLRNRIAPDGTTAELATMQAAQARGAKVWSTPWSPPAIYKDTNSVNGGDFVGTAANYQGYANQLAAYAANMRSNGVNLCALSIQNEPDVSATYESCIWTAQQFHDFLPYLSAAMTHYGVASTRIMIAEDECWQFDLTATAMGDTNTAGMVGVLAAHNYCGIPGPVTNPSGMPLWETEVSTFDAFDGSITNGMDWAEQIHTFMTVVEANAWHYWWLIPYAPNGLDNESLIDTNGNPTKRMYVLGNYSRFVRPGYYRIGVSNAITALVSAYKDPDTGHFAIVALNTTFSTSTQTFNLTNFSSSTVTPWITSSNLSLEGQTPIPIISNTFTYALPAMSVVTFVGQTNNTTPTITSFTTDAGQVTLTMDGPAASSYTLLTSSNLINWQGLLTTNWPALPVTLIDATANAAPVRFYRIQVGP